jgi:PAS domain S-box-containing protein
VRELEEALRLAQRQADTLRAELDEVLDDRSALEEAIERYADLFDSAPVAYLCLDEVGAIRAANRAACELLNCPRSRVIDHPLGQFLIHDDRAPFNRHLASVRRSASTFARQLRIRRSNGKKVHAQLIGCWVSEPRTELRVMLFETRLDEHAAAERERLLQAEETARQANAAKDDFIAALSHELRTPLTPVLAAVTALSAGEVKRDQLTSLLELVHRNVASEARLIDDLLDVTRIARGKLHLDLQVTDVHQVVLDALRTLADRIEAKGHALTVELEATRHFVNGDPMRLKQVFWNLIGNAVKFTPLNGMISVRSWNHDSYLAIEVSDNGEGIEEHTLELIFAPFEQGERHTQSRTGGLGLGLAISRGLVELHTGKIAASSAGHGKGSRFVVELSTVPTPSESEAPPPSDEITQAALELPKPKILLVEDDSDSAEALVLSLEASGYDVKLAANGREALAIDLEGIDIVVSDIGLPDMTGHELVRALLETRSIPAIALSGYGTERDRRASEKAGFVAHLTKPIEVQTLTTTIQKVMLGELKAKSAKRSPPSARAGQRSS